MTDQDFSSTEQRPDPEALLALAQKEGRGRLRIFLGAAPGVGKTYEMLRVARQRRREGVDVVVGVVETHGRAETQRMLAGLEILPKRASDYKGRALPEMDLDAILARKPALVLVDELAHTNAPGSRHPKRYLDVEEILASGIDVFTTLNVQHVESLNDVVARITRIRVRETVPDSIIDRADEIELVDVTPETLQQRLAEGKVYGHEQAQRALKHYFSAGNLTALRELALRRTADRVDAQMRDFMQSHAISGPWETGERLLVCIDPRPAADLLIRQARRMADRLRCAWTVLHIETPSPLGLSDAARTRIAEAMRLAERLGAETVTLPGRRVADDVMAYARSHNVTQIIVGHYSLPRWKRWLSGSITQELVRKASDISLRIVPLGTGGAAVSLALPKRPPLSAFLEATLTVGAATVIAAGLDRLIAVTNLSLVFLTGVLVVAVRRGRGPSLYAAALSVLFYNFLFLPPLYTFTIADPANVISLTAFFITALMTSDLAARTHAQGTAAAQRAKVTADLYSFSRKLAAIGAMDDLLWAISHQIAAMLKVSTVVLLPEGQHLTVRAGYPPEDRLEDSDLAAAQWAFSKGQETGRDSDTLPGARWLFVPLRTDREVIGVLGLDREERGRPILSQDERRLLNALADQAAIAIERITLAGTVDEARLLAETEKLRGALLTSISHDLRTPLATILGSVTALRSFGARYDDAARDEVLGSVQTEAERLNRFVGNLLDMMRLEAGSLAPKQDPLDLAEAVGTALRRTAALLAGHRVETHLPDDLPMVRLDHVLFEQVLVNLLDNAAKYAPKGSIIRLEAQEASDGGVRLSVADQGPGIPPDRRASIFERFYRLDVNDSAPSGTGLGLAICRGFVEAMGGRIQVEDAPSGGAAFVISLPETLLHVEPLRD